MIIRQNKQNHPKVIIRNPKSHWKIGKTYSSPTYLQEPIECWWLDGPLEANEFVKETRGVLMLLWVHRGGEYLLLLTRYVRICITGRVYAMRYILPHKASGGLGGVHNLC